MTRSHDWQGWLRDLVEVRDNELQIAQYVAVQAGIRRSLDDWIPVAQFPAFTGLMDRLGLIVRPDCIFRSLNGESTAGLDLTPTTRAAAVRFSGDLKDHPPNAAVHVIVSRRSDWADEALACAWYSVAVHGRVVFKPFIDYYRLGFAFGYPSCCVEFFLRHNDWPRFNTLAEAARRSRELHWETNRLLKSTPWMLIFHLPCSFDCEATRRQARDILRAIREQDPGYAGRIEERLRGTFLALSESVSFSLVEGEVTGVGRVRYSAAVPLQRPHGAQEDWKRRNAEALARGDELRIEDGIIYIYSRGRLVRTLESRCDRGVAEVPLLLSFP